MQTTDWRHYTVEFTDPTAAEAVAVADLAPALTAAQRARLLHNWWYLRKGYTWRVRHMPDDPSSTAVSDLLDALALDGRIVGWAPGIYEPETVAFGGEAAMDIAHELFHHDSRHVLTRATSPPTLGRRETSMVLCSVLLRSAGLDWYEQGDVWAKVAALRPADPSDPAPALRQAEALTRAMHRLMTVDARALCAPGRPLTGHGQWITTFETAGQALAHLARHGRLQRGLRAVLAHHVIFHANRAGLSLQDQSAMAALALNTVFADPGDAVPSTTTRRKPE